MKLLFVVSIVIWATLLFSASHALPQRLRRLSEIPGDPLPTQQDLDDGRSCEVEEFQLASDGTIALGGQKIGEQVTPNVTVNGTVAEDEFRFFHMCVVRHEHEHAVTVNLTVLTPKGGDANLYLSSEHRHPRVGQSTWISQRVGDDSIKLYTYLDGFPRREGGRSIPLHIGVRGMSEQPVTFAISVAVDDLPVSSDVDSRQRYYSAVRRQLRSAKSPPPRHFEANAWDY